MGMMGKTIGLRKQVEKYTRISDLLKPQECWNYRIFFFKSWQCWWEKECSEFDLKHQNIMMNTLTTWNFDMFGFVQAGEDPIEVRLTKLAPGGSTGFGVGQQDHGGERATKGGSSCNVTNSRHQRGLNVNGVKFNHHSVCDDIYQHGTRTRMVS